MDDDRELAFRIRLRMTLGILKLGGQSVGEVSGRVTVPLQALYRPRPSPGQYLFSPPQARGQIVPRSPEPSAVTIETMGYLDVDAVVSQLQIPDSWKIIPNECLSGLQLEAELEFEDVDADDEYKLNEPDDLATARALYEGRWSLVIRLDLDQSIPRDEHRLDLDRWECEADGRYATFEGLP
jgi:hypothetical protein